MQNSATRPDARWLGKHTFSKRWQWRDGDPICSIRSYFEAPSFSATTQQVGKSPVVLPVIL